jgi:hypothetical protein
VAADLRAAATLVHDLIRNRAIGGNRETHERHEILISRKKADGLFARQIVDRFHAGNGGHHRSYFRVFGVFRGDAC